QWEVRQSASGALFSGPYAANDVFRIAVENNVVRYYQNNILRYISLVAPTLPLLVDVSVFTQGGTVSNAVVANVSNGVFTATAVNAGSAPVYQWKLNGANVGTNSPTYSNGLLANGSVITCELTPDIPGCAATSYVSNSVEIIPITQPLTTTIIAQGVLASPTCLVAEGPVVWNPSSLVNTIATNNNLLKFQSNGPWNGGAASSNTVSNNGYFQFTATETNTDRMVGLSSTNINADWTSIQYVVYLRGNSQWEVRQSGSGALFSGPYAANDVFRIAVENNVVRYYQNNILRYTSLVSPSLPLLVDVSIATQGGTVTNALIANTNNGAFTISVSGVGSNPTYQWKLNGSNVGTNSTTYTNTSISAGDVIACLVTPDLPGCSTTQYASNNITIRSGVPVIVCPPSQTVVLNASCQAVMPDYRPIVTSPSNCVLTLTQSPAPGTILSGTNPVTVTITATNSSGVSTSCSFGLSPLDTTPPVASCPADITVNAPAGACGAVVNYTVSGSDNCSTCAGGTIPGFVLIGSFNNRIYYRSTAATTWPVANTTAISLGGHLATINSAAENAFFSGIGRHWIGLTDQAVEGTWVWSNGEPVTYLNWASGQPDNSGNEDFAEINWSGQQWNDFNGSLPYIVEFSCLTNIVSGLPSGSVFPVGTTTISYTITDASGNLSPCSFTVTVNDATPPTITCPANIVTTTSPGTCTRSVVTPNPTTNDNCGVTRLSWVLTGATTGSSPVTGINNLGTQVFNGGITTVTYTVGDASGNTTTCSFTVTVNDNIAPTITCPANQTVAFGPGCNLTLPDYTGLATATDNCAFTITQSPAVGTVITGTTTVTLTVTDIGGNSTSCTFQVIPTDQTPPVITCPANVTLPLNASCNLTLPAYTAATLSDNCSAVGAITVVQSPAAGTVLSGAGTTTVTLTATDAAGNSSSCTFNVVRADQTAPVITCPANQTVAFSPSCNFTLPSYTALATTADNCDASLTLTQSPAVGTVITGTTT
ncbi:MAG: HYR domain-containing protein, partial [Flavobacteriales bacterium]